jgi:hypothetical protein
MDKELVRSHVQEISRLHKEAESGYKTTVEKVLRIGELLTECKKEYGTYGLWMSWLESNKETLGFGYVTANNYINAYERRDKFTPGVNLKELYYPQLEHKEPEPLPVRLQPPVEPKVEPPPQNSAEAIEEEPESKDDEWLDEPLTDEQDDWVEDIKDLYVKLDDDHKGLVIDWILEYKEAA